MDWVPLFFIDDVCHQLRAKSLRLVSELSGSWVRFSSEHCVKRHEFAFNCDVDWKGGAYCLVKREDRSFTAEVADLDLEYDRITKCDFTIINHPRNSSDTRRIPVSMDQLQRDVLPTVASLAMDCSWPYLVPDWERNQLFFKAFQNCPGFNDIRVYENKEELRDFVARQVEFGNVETLDLQTPLTWPPEPENLVETLKTFVSSSRFGVLYACGPMRNDFELVELFMERALAGELKEGARIRINDISVDTSRPSTLYPEHRDDDSEEIAWRIPNSNRRIVDLTTLNGVPGTVLLQVV